MERALKYELRRYEVEAMDKITEDHGEIQQDEIMLKHCTGVLIN